MDKPPGSGSKIVKKRTLTNVLVKKSWKPNVVPNMPVSSLPIDTSVLFESSTCDTPDKTKKKNSVHMHAPLTE